MPTAFNSPPDSSWRNRIALAIVAPGDMVGNCIVLRSAGPVPTPQTNLVPPASIAPNIFFCIRLKESATEPGGDKISPRNCPYAHPLRAYRRVVTDGT